MPSKTKKTTECTYHSTVLISTPDNKQSTITMYNRNFKNAAKLRSRTYINAIDETATIECYYIIGACYVLYIHLPHRSPLRSTKNAGSSRANCSFVSVGKKKRRTLLLSVRMLVSFSSQVESPYVPFLC